MRRKPSPGFDAMPLADRADPSGTSCATDSAAALPDY